MRCMGLFRDWLGGDGADDLFSFCHGATRTEVTSVIFGAARCAGIPEPSLDYRPCKDIAYRVGHAPASPAGAYAAANRRASQLLFAHLSPRGWRRPVADGRTGKLRRRPIEEGMHEAEPHTMQGELDCRIDRLG